MVLNQVDLVEATSDKIKELDKSIDEADKLLNKFLAFKQ